MGVDAASGCRKYNYNIYINRMRYCGKWVNRLFWCGQNDLKYSGACPDIEAGELVIMVWTNAFK